MVLLIHGQPGNGKTTIALAIASVTKVPLMHVDDVYRSWLGVNVGNIFVDWNNRDEKFKAEFKENLIKQIKPNSIVDGWQLEDMLDDIAKEHSCVAIRMCGWGAYFGENLIAHKDRLEPILQLCKWK